MERHGQRLYRPIKSPSMSIATGPTALDGTRALLLDAAVHEFAAHGFEGASTRAIARRAGVHQPQINYHFSSKLDLWRATVDHLFAELADEVRSATDPGVDDLDRLVRTIGAVVRHAARRPELNRIMVKESSVVDDRLVWLVDTHVRDRFEAHRVRWDRLRVEGAVVDIDATHAFYLLLGAATLVYTNAPEARMLTGVDPTASELVDRHAAALVHMFVISPRSPS